MITSPADLAASISEVIENLTMMVAQPVETWESFEPQLAGTIEFAGPAAGKMTVRCPDGFALFLAANLLGAEKTNLTQAHAWDALAELLNVVCGNLVTTLFDPQKPFTLSTPQIHELSPGESDEAGVDASGGAHRYLTRLLLDDVPVEFCIEVD